MKTPEKNLLVLATFLISFSLQAAECRLYNFSGVVRITKKNGHQLILNEKSNSEVRLKIPKENLIKFASYLDSHIKGSIVINDNQEILSYDAIRLTTPDPLKIKNEVTYGLVTKDNCDNLVKKI